AAVNIANICQPLNKISDKEKKQLRCAGKYFRCRKPGHVAINCRSGRSMNNLDTETGDDSRKAEGEM
ncbi:hypothetical protein BGZ65_009826, partial [Modicella reniformis]